MKMCEQIFNTTVPQYNSNSLNCKKNHDVLNNSRYRFAAIKKTNDLVLTDYKPTNAGWLALKRQVWRIILEEV